MSHSLRMTCFKGILTLLIGTSLTVGCSSDDDSHPGVAELASPPKNPYLADTAWPTNHGDPYYQQFSEYPGPLQPPAGEPDFLLGRPAMLNSYFSETYPDGEIVIWGTCLGQVYKVDPTGDDLAYIDRIDVEEAQWVPESMAAYLSTQPSQQVGDVLVPMLPPAPELHEGESGQGTSGHYCVLASDGLFYQPLGKKIMVYGDEIPGDRFSPIEIKDEWEIPAEQLSVEWDKIIGMQMTYDGKLVFFTNYALVGVVERSFENAWFLQLGEGDEYNFNSFAVGDDGGIYVATHKAMYRVQWTGEKLTINEDEGGWRAEYGTGRIDELGVQTLAGTGSSPSLMGVGEDEDRFVVITDGEELMSILLFWRDEIPEDWEQIPGTKSRRVAAMIPITFGDPERTESFSDQSVLVKGYGAFVVNNEVGATWDHKVASIMYGGLPEYAPWGCEKFEWDPEARELKSVWVNNDVSLPNAVPTMSAETNLIYEIGQRDGVWTLEALDWDTGALSWYYEIGIESRYNSAFSATIVGPDECIYYGSFWGMARVCP